MRRAIPQWFSVLACGLAGAAAAQLPVASPQWSVTFDVRQRLDEQTFPQMRESWALLGDGSAALVSHNFSTNLRIFGGDGQLIEQSHLPGGDLQIPRLAAERLNTGLYALMSPRPGLSGHSALYRYRRGAEPVQVAGILRSPEVAADPAQALLVQADDSVVVRSQYSVSRYGSSGAPQWFHYRDPVSAGHFQPLAMAQAGDGTVWLAGHGGTQDGNAPPAFAAVWRLRADGTFLSTQTFRCASCSDSRALGISVLPDGRAVAVGSGGAGEPGFIALFEADGSLFRRIDTAPDQGYDRVLHDQAGHVYLFAQDRQQISAIDAGDGTLRWTLPGSDVAALAAGVLISRPVAQPSGSLSVDAHGVDGQLLWSRQLEAADGLAAGGAERGADGVIRVFTTFAQASSGDCGSVPRLHQLGADGQPLARLADCLQRRNPYIAEVQSLPGAGVMVDVASAAEVIRPDGRRAWRYSACGFCNTVYASIAGMHLQPDGSAWLLAYLTFPPVQTQAELLRIGADGQVLLREPLSLPATATNYRSVLIGDAQQVIVLAPGEDRLGWWRYSANGELHETRSHAWSEREGVQLKTQPLPDGGVSLHAFRFDDLSCLPSPPNCGPNENTVMRLDAEGGLRWSREFGEGVNHIGLEAEGGAAVFYSWIFGGVALKVQHVDADGTPGALIEIPDSTSSGSRFGISGPVAGRYLVSRISSAAGDTEFLLLDRNGQVFLRRDADPYTGPQAHAAPGFLVNRGFNDATLLSAQDLTLIADFITGYPIPGVSYDTLWHMSDNGDVYTVARPIIEPGIPRVTRFAVPGTPAAEVIFSARFD